ncbi:MAG: hypothetical protein KKG60_03140 [Nanoarchaeota archaeon]|nr:hypothetical protein [Nanoarchaeota archaeon]
MKILFLVTGIGLGHSIREHSIIKSIVKKMPDVQIKVIGFKNSYDYFKKHGYDVEKIRGYSFSGEKLKIDKTKLFFLNLGYPFRFLFNLFRVGKIAFRFNPDIIVCDAQPEGIVVGKLLRKKVVLVYNLYMGDKVKGSFSNLAVMLKNLFYPLIHKIINPSLLNVRRTEGNVELIPPIVRDKLIELPVEAVLMKKLGLKKRPIIVQIGGSKFGGKLVDNLVEVSKDFPDEKFLVFGSKKKKTSNVSFLPFKSNFLEYLKVGKVVITLAGHEILSEIIHFRKASLVFPIAYVEQMENARVMRKNKLAVVGSHHQNQPDELKLLIEKVLERKGEIEKRILDLGVRENGADVAAKLILGIKHTS